MNQAISACYWYKKVKGWRSKGKGKIIFDNLLNTFVSTLIEIQQIKTVYIIELEMMIISEFML